MTKRIGFACKWIDHAGQVDGIKPKDDAKKFANLIGPMDPKVDRDVREKLAERNLTLKSEI